jgi:protein involved in polysaccharide export with SLBB domain
VRSPGQYFLRGATTLLDLLSSAGIGDSGVDEVRVTRGGEGGETTRISYARLLADGSGNLQLSGGDIVFVPESLIVIMGQVGDPGELAFREGMTVATAVAAAGGALPTANLGRVYLLRGEERQRVNLRKVMSGRHTDVPLKPGDRVVVRESVF